MNKTPLARKLERENERLKNIIVDIAWMARRYADGRKTYAVSMYNDACFDACKLGCNIRPDFAEGDRLFARDGMEDDDKNVFMLSPEKIAFEAEYVAQYKDRMNKQ